MWLSIQEAADYSGYTINYLRMLLYRKQLIFKRERVEQPPGTMGSRVRVFISVNSLERYLEERGWPNAAV
jgi:hypothetical protein